ncbi:hypothetical protein VTO73DRAFT_11672 [Trametes versicolor]
MARGRKANGVKVQCQFCEGLYVNIRSHELACRRKVKIVSDAEKLAEHIRAGPSNLASHPYAAAHNARRANPLPRAANPTDEDSEAQHVDLDSPQDQVMGEPAPAPAPNAPPPLVVVLPDSTPDTPPQASASSASAPVTAETFAMPTFRPPTLVNPPDLVQDDFLVVHHPRSQIPPTVHHFNDFIRSTPDVDPTKLSKTPWKPFRSRVDFEFADFTQKTSLNQGQIDELLGLISRIVEGPSNFSFKSSGDVKGAWETAAHLSPAYTHHTVSHTYKKEQEPRKFPFHCRPLFEWGLSLLADPVLATKFSWHAVRHYKYDGETWERFVDEPNTADAWWNLESAIPADGSPLCFEVYADKTRLSSFGTQKGYPIMARVANLPAEIRNGTGFGGTEVVGFLPIVESEAEEGKKGFTNFKRAIWHDSFKILVHTVSQHAKTGYKFQCGDDIERILYPVIIILVADYEEQCDLIPRWRDLNHFSEVCAVTFTDGTKYEDISKILVPSSYKVLTPQASRRGHLLLRILRVYNKLDVLAGLDVHRESTLRKYAAGLVELYETVQAYSAEYPDKNWNFPKFHTHQHLIQDIITKGASKNFNAKTFEGGHRPIKDIYIDQTNFKEVEVQITRIQHMQTISKGIRFHIALFDEFQNPKKAAEPNELFQFNNVHLGSAQATTCAEVEQRHTDNRAFRRFRLQLEEFLNRRIQRDNLDRNWIKVSPTHKLVETRYIRVDYESVVNWKQDTDHLRCNPSFYNAPRFDHIIYNIDDHTIGFAQLLFVCVCSFNNIQVPLALVQPLDIVKTPRSNADRGMGLRRVRRSPANPPDFILVTSIIRGALITEDLDEDNQSTGDFLVIDVVDGDMFLRLERDFPAWGT